MVSDWNLHSWLNGRPFIKASPIISGILAFLEKFSSPYQPIQLASRNCQAIISAIKNGSPNHVAREYHENG
jgi:hypothetical protein